MKKAVFLTEAEIDRRIRENKPESGVSKEYVDDEIRKIKVKNFDEAINTLDEISDWVKNSGEALPGKVTSLESSVGEILPYKSRIEAVEAAYLSKSSTPDIVYGTNDQGEQTTYDKNSFGRVNNISVDGLGVGDQGTIVSYNSETRTFDIGLQSLFDLKIDYDEFDNCLNLSTRYSDLVTTVNSKLNANVIGDWTPSSQAKIDQEIREIAEGKTAAYILSYSDGNNITPSDYASCIPLDRAEPFESAEDFSDYIGFDTCLNGSFNNQSNLITYANQYLILKGSEANTFKIIKSENFSDIFKTGDVFLVIETDVPDRWFNIDGFYKLETTKVNLSSVEDRVSNLESTVNATGNSALLKKKDVMLADGPFSDAQRNAIDSGITSEILNSVRGSISSLTTDMGSMSDTVDELSEKVEGLESSNLPLKIGTGESSLLQESRISILNSDITWSSADDSIVSVDENGEMTSNGEGSTTVQGQLDIDGVVYSATCNVLVGEESLDNNSNSESDDTLLQSSETSSDGGTFVDTLTNAVIGINATSYSTWSKTKADNVNITSNTTYAGNSAGGNSAIQLRATDPSGIVTTTSGGKVKSIKVVWNSNTANGRTLNIFGKNTAYSSSGDLYNNDNRGTALGTIVYGTSTELVVNGDYEYIGMRSNASAMYIDSIEITWEKEAAPIIVQSIELNLSQATLSPDDTITLEARVNPSNANDTRVSFSSNNTSVATVDETTGEVTAHSLGTAIITVSSLQTGSSATASCTVIVTESSTRELVLNYTSYTFNAIGETAQLNASLFIPSNKANADLSFVGGEASKSSAGHYDSFVYGIGLQTNDKNQAIFGKFNKTAYETNDDKPTFIVGNGSSAQRSNAFEVYSDGHAEVIKTGDTENSVATKGYIDNFLTTISGYDPTKTQVLKNINGTFTWVDEE